MNLLTIALALSFMAVQQQTATSRDGVTAPVVIKMVNPKYPHSIFHKTPVGDVLVELKVDTQGLPEDVTIAASSGNDALDQSALDAVRQYRFQPAMKDGRPVVVGLKVVINFHAH